jgi:ribonuclease D
LTKILISNTKNLKEHVDRILKNPPLYVSVDTEFVRQHTYFPKLGVIQIGFKDESWLIDAMTCTLEPLDPLLFNDNIIKVFHSARQDLEIIYSLFQKVPTPFFDIQIAASFLGFGHQPSLEHVALSYIDLKLDKEKQFSNWCDRPLSKEMIDYAFEDARSIYDLYPYVLKALKDQGRDLWVSDAHLSLQNIILNPINKDKIFSKLRHSLTKKRSIQQLLELSLWREEKTQLHNKPREHFLNYKTMEKLIQNLPLSKERFKSILFQEKPIDYVGIKKEIRQELFLFLNDLTLKKNLIEIESNAKGHKENEKRLKEYVLQKSIELAIESSFILDKEEIKKYCKDEIYKNTLPPWKQEILKDFKNSC